MFKKLYRFFQNRDIFLVLLYIFLMHLPPSYGSAMFYFYTNLLKFTPAFLSILRALNSVSMVGGIALYYIYFKNVILYMNRPN